MTKDIPAGVIAVGNPCKVKRKITDKDMFDTVQELLEANSKVVQKNPSHCLVILRKLQTAYGSFIQRQTKVLLQDSLL